MRWSLISIGFPSQLATGSASVTSHSMLRMLLAAGFLAAGSLGSALAVDPPSSVASEGERGYVHGELIYELHDAPTPQCHASTIADTESGLVAAWFGGTHEKHPDVGIWVSRREADGWTAAVEVADGTESGTKSGTAKGAENGSEYPCWNPVLFQPSRGPLLLFYKVGPSPSEWWGMLMTSDDGGKSWSEPRRLGENDRIGHLLGPVKNKPIELADGSILAPSSTEHAGWRVHFERLGRSDSDSPSGGQWNVVEVIGPTHSAEHFNAIQPSILTYPEGAMQVLCRTREGVLAESWSRDGGRTWGDMAATELPNPNSGTDAVTLRDGRQLLVYNHTTRQGEFPSGRQMLNVALSDDGHRWRPVLTLERQEGEFSYPAVIQARDGRVHLTYTYNRRSIKHVVLDPASLE
ncbi:sialidase family protein [Candidatus Laterigemmans baculatus]|uniref:sialidase family protein n=1 Tax=Candidatus Laterigemmans baculatus TaxID=2770505 RepID=UPI001F237BB2|nr:sialidase family protein [Candidatus Laterigemmans baculatus]